MEGRWRTILTVLCLSAVLSIVPAPVVLHAQGVSGGTPVATVGDEVITLEELEASLGGELAELEERRHALLSGRLGKLIEERLLAQEARRRAVTVEQLLKEEVGAKARDVSEAEVDAFMTQNRARLPSGGDEVLLRLKVWDYLRAQRVQQRRQQYMAALGARGRVVVSLPEPAIRRVEVSPAKGFARGPADADVVIVEFSDFQCPFCKRVLGTVRRLFDLYPGKIKWVFRDFPIQSLHPTAPKAHEAARCAGDQGKFWEYHDLLFDRSPRHAPHELKQYARELDLDGAAFARCLDSGVYQRAIASDIREGGSLGVTGTPTFFVNGRKLAGSRPLAAFQRLIDSELAQTRR